MLWLITSSFTKTATPQFKNNPNKTKQEPQIKPLCSLHLAFILTSLTRVSRIGNIKPKSIK